MTEAFVTLATTDTYCLGALVLGYSLRKANTSKKLAVMISNDVSFSIRNQLQSVYDDIRIVDVLDSTDTSNLALLSRPDLGVTFTKLHCWRLTEYQKCVFLDADTLVLQNVDELFDYEEFSAAHDPGWPDCFNSGVFVFRPSLETYTSLLQFAVQHGSFDGGDQGLLNLYYKNWAREDISKHLPFTYNVVSQAFYSYLPAFTQFGKDIKIVHFIGEVKPWHHSIDPVSRAVQVQPGVGHDANFLQTWWNIFMDHINPTLNRELISGTPGGLPSGLARLIPSAYSTTHAPELSDQERFQEWERGNIDYLGKDAWSNIEKQLEESVKNGNGSSGGGSSVPSSVTSSGERGEAPPPPIEHPPPPAPAKPAPAAAAPPTSTAAAAPPKPTAAARAPAAPAPAAPAKKAAAAAPAQVQAKPVATHQPAAAPAQPKARRGTAPQKGKGK